MAYLTQMSLMKKNQNTAFRSLRSGMTFQSKQQNNATLTYFILYPKTNFNIISIGIQIFSLKKCCLQFIRQIGQSWPELTRLRNHSPWHMIPTNSCVEVEQTLKKVRK